ncbi:type III-A CRISPR-associated protein Csm2 [Rhodothermus marinus]|uniref:type III-A CRISPR-associated protein Csm2 n=1 Tax=Rhodothermus marinus TaxID=29549 RepID=UPI0012BA41AD|nr:type III-A CRISPR-associated protein Csm2 [Rhodothermus marinus]BBM69611.1 type III-A CRISPR-associated protein Csm2 [Rhodothermus marinus]BBM72593.1 type III-A CRISPR-associated protein Csm2 [Rhodothermus marinus]
MDIPKDLAELEPEAIDRLAHDMGRKYAEKEIKTAQVRNVFAHINRMRTRLRRNRSVSPEIIKRDLVMLKPRLAYAGGRQEKVRPMSEDLRQVVNAVLNSQSFEKALQNFFDLVEGIVAYHKFYGGKDN